MELYLSITICLLSLLTLWALWTRFHHVLVPRVVLPRVVDYIVIGAGASGWITARELSSKGSVLVIEEGDHVGFSYARIPIFDRYLVSTPFDASTRVTGTPFRLPAGRCVGGSFQTLPLGLTLGSQADHARIEAAGGTAFSAPSLAAAFESVCTLVPPAVPVLGHAMAHYALIAVATIIRCAAFLAGPFRATHASLTAKADRVARGMDPLSKFSLTTPLPPSPLAWFGRAAAQAVGCGVHLNPLTAHTAVPAVRNAARQGGKKGGAAAAPAVVGAVVGESFSLTVGPVCGGARDTVETALPVPVLSERAHRGGEVKVGERGVAVAPAYTVSRLVLEGEEGETGGKEGKKGASVDRGVGTVVGVEVVPFDSASLLFNTTKSGSDGKGEGKAEGKGHGGDEKGRTSVAKHVVYARRGVVVAAGSARGAALVVDARERVEASMAARSTADGGVRTVLAGSAAGYGGAPYGLGASYETRKGISSDTRNIQTASALVQWLLTGGGPWSLPRVGGSLFLHSVAGGAKKKGGGGDSGVTLASLRTTVGELAGVGAASPGPSGQNESVVGAGQCYAAGALGATWLELDTAGGFDAEHFARMGRRDSLLAYFREAMAWWGWTCGVDGRGVRVKISASGEAQLSGPARDGAPLIPAETLEAGGGIPNAALLQHRDVEECVGCIADALRVAHYITKESDLSKVCTGRSAVALSRKSVPTDDTKSKEKSEAGEEVTEDDAKKASGEGAKGKKGAVEGAEGAVSVRAIEDVNHVMSLCVEHGELGPLAGTLAMGHDDASAVDPYTMGVRGFDKLYAVGRAVLPGPSVGGDGGLAIAVSVIGAQHIAAATQ